LRPFFFLTLITLSSVPFERCPPSFPLPLIFPPPSLLFLLNPPQRNASSTTRGLSSHSCPLGLHSCPFSVFSLFFQTTFRPLPVPLSNLSRPSRPCVTGLLPNPFQHPPLSLSCPLLTGSSNTLFPGMSLSLFPLPPALFAPPLSPFQRLFCPSHPGLCSCLLSLLHLRHNSLQHLVPPSVASGIRFTLSVCSLPLSNTNSLFLLL